jgi:hypothetical protein
LPCRRSRVRVPSSASKPPVNRGFLFCELATCVPDESPLPNRICARRPDSEPTPHLTAVRRAEAARQQSGRRRRRPRVRDPRHPGWSAPHDQPRLRRRKADSDPLHRRTAPSDGDTEQERARDEKVEGSSPFIRSVESRWKRPVFNVMIARRRRRRSRGSAWCPSRSRRNLTDVYEWWWRANARTRHVLRMQSDGTRLNWHRGRPEGSDLHLRP